MYKTVFFGTHNFATTILQGLINDPLFDVQLVITQPDKPVGREQELQASPVKLLAIENNIAVEQPISLKNFNFNQEFDLGITAQYGLIIPQTILDAPKHGIINVHTSLLPKYRGASPIQSALVAGEKETGVTIMKMDAGMDTGPIILQEKMPIDPDDTYPDLDKKLADLAITTLIKTIPDYISGVLPLIAQNNDEATYCKQLSREDGKIDWQKSAQEIYNQYRGLTPWPGVWTMLNGKRLKLLKIKPATKKLTAGEILVDNKQMFVGCGSDSVEILELQLEGKRSTLASEFCSGYQVNGTQITMISRINHDLV